MPGSVGYEWRTNYVSLFARCSSCQSVREGEGNEHRSSICLWDCYPPRPLPPASPLLRSGRECALLLLLLPYLRRASSSVLYIRFVNAKKTSNSERSGADGRGSSWRARRTDEGNVRCRPNIHGRRRRRRRRCGGGGDYRLGGQVKHGNNMREASEGGSASVAMPRPTLCFVTKKNPQNSMVFSAPEAATMRRNVSY